MNTQIVKNNVIRQEGDEKLYRVLWTDGTIAYVIDLNDGKNGFPYVKSINDIKWAIHTEKATKLEHDPYLRILDEEKLLPSAKLNRDQNYKTIEPLVQNTPAIFLPRVRGPMVKAAAQHSKLSIVTVNSLLRKYWRGGQTKDALVPDYDKRGGRNKNKRAGEMKRGAPRDLGGGINIREADLANIRKALENYYYKRNGHNLRDTYALMLRDYYKIDVRYDAKGRKYVILDDVNNAPSYKQFLYWYEKEKDSEKEVRDKEGDHAYDLYHRPQIGSSTLHIFGPGDEFQIDSTIGDIYLRSSYHIDWIIGRPIIYKIIDVFSQLITGIYVGLEGPSWLAQASALANCASDKQSFCAQYGIPLGRDEWPSRHIPKLLLGDRGETKSIPSEKLSDRWAVSVDVAAPLRPDWKGLVEGQFNFITGKKLKPLMPGTVTKQNLKETRKGRQYELDAILTLEDFTAIMIEHVRKYNKRWLKSYVIDREMIEHGVKPIPIELWKWGAEHRPNALKEVPEDLFKLSLMPAGKALISENGLSFENLYYSSEAVLDRIKVAAIKKKTSSIEICYDPRNMNKVYIPAKDGRAYAVCNMLEWQTKYIGKSLWDIKYEMKFQSIGHKKQLTQENQSNVDYLTGVEQIVALAKKRAEAAPENGKTNAQRIQDIPQNRKFDKEMNRQKEAFSLGDNTVFASPPALQPEDSSILNDQDQLSARSSRIDLLSRKQRELKGEK
jgi:hypothetical protein